MRTTEFLQLITHGENERVEFKSDVKNIETLIRDVVAFANTEGGVILCGVGNDGELLGMRQITADHFMAKMARVVQHIPIEVSIDILEIDGKIFGAISVPKAPDFLSPIMTANGQAFIRAGESLVLKTDFGGDSRGNRTAPTEKLRMFVAMSFQFEEEPALVDYYEAIARATKSSEVPIELVRMDLEEGDYEITTEIINRICECDIVLADFTLNSPNVYFEAGVAVGAKKRLIRTVRKDTTVSFDIKTHKIIIYSNATQLESALPGAIKAAYDYVLRERRLATLKT